MYYAEVLYFFFVVKNDQCFTLAAVNMYSPPDPHILQESYNVLRVCTHLGNSGVVVIDAKSIVDVIVMAPYRRRKANEYWVIEKMETSYV